MHPIDASVPLARVRDMSGSSLDNVDRETHLEKTICPEAINISKLEDAWSLNVGSDAFDEQAPGAVVDTNLLWRVIVVPGCALHLDTRSVQLSVRIISVVLRLQ